MIASVGIYAAVEAQMLTDYSPGYADTWEALDRAMQDVAELGKLRHKVSQVQVLSLKLPLVWFSR